ncbi:MAG: serine hydrolase family protein [Neisseriaceae bacterium]|nr:serine hydrolase family protein [Neisseriaceae bacterium]
MKTVYVIHGFEANPASHWFPWLKLQLNRRSVQAQVLSMPHPSDPQLDEWVGHLQAKVVSAPANTYFVAHSLGCVMLLAYLAQHPPKTPFAGMVLVSGFYEYIPQFPALAPLADHVFDFPALQDSVRQRVCVASSNDTIVPPEYSLRLAQKMNARHCLIDNGGHFTQHEGFSKLPLVNQLLQEMMTD